MPTEMVIFVQATYVLATFAHISNISAGTGPILTKLFGPDFFGALKPWWGANWPIENLRGYISGTECRIHLKPGCEFKFFHCVEV